MRLSQGRESFDVQDWRRHSVFRGFATDAPQPGWLGELLEEGDLAFRRGLLRYSTGAIPQIFIDCISFVPSLSWQSDHFRFIYKLDFCI